MHGYLFIQKLIPLFSQIKNSELAQFTDYLSSFITLSEIYFSAEQELLMFRATMQLLAILDEKRVEEPTYSTTVFPVFDSKLSLTDASRKLNEFFEISNTQQRNLKNIEFCRTINLHIRAWNKSR